MSAPRTRPRPRPSPYILDGHPTWNRRRDTHARSRSVATTSERRRRRRHMSTMLRVPYRPRPGHPTAQLGRTLWNRRGHGGVVRPAARRTGGRVYRRRERRGATRISMCVYWPAPSGCDGCCCCQRDCRSTHSARQRRTTCGKGRREGRGGARSVGNWGWSASPSSCRLRVVLYRRVLQTVWWRRIRRCLRVPRDLPLSKCTRDLVDVTLRIVRTAVTWSRTPIVL